MGRRRHRGDRSDVNPSTPTVIATVSAADLAASIAVWRQDGGRLSQLDETTQRAIHRIEHEQAVVSIDLADRILVRLGLQTMLAELAGPPSPGKRSGLWTRPHPLRKLSPEQVAAAHKLHAAGMSIRELGRQLWLKLGYASPGSCANAISDAFKRGGLARTPAAEMTRRRCTTHGLSQDREHRLALRRARGEIQRERCQSQKRDGEPCNRWAMFGSTFCWNHDADRLTEVQALCAAMRDRRA